MKHIVWTVEVWKFFPYDVLQKFRQINFSPKESSYSVNQFDEKFLQWGEKFRNYHTVKQLLWLKKCTKIAFDFTEKFMK